jgi:oxygen-independent coproporphyrinogen-3 oxidase
MIHYPTSATVLQPPTALIRQAVDRYDAYEMDALPRALRRNSLDYYYLSIYPSLAEMRPFGPDDRPPYPDTMRSLYIHVPFCSGVCEFCSYYLVAISPAKRERISRYLAAVARELEFHAQHTQLDINYLFIGGGTPSLMPLGALTKLLAHMHGRGWLNPQLLGTLELHPEFFGDRPRAERFLDVLWQYGLRRVSVGYQMSDEQLLAATRRRHQAHFIDDAMRLLRDRGFTVNLDLMYGLAGQSLASWETTLRTAVALAPDSLSTYFLFVDRGTVTHDRVMRGEIVLPDHRHSQTQHLMAQLFLAENGYWELPNDFHARGVVDGHTFQPDRLPSQSATLPVGPGAYGHYSRTQLANVFDLPEYERRMAAGDSPLWRGYRLDADHSFHRDVMFSLKNDPYLDCSLFIRHYNINPIEVFAATFERLVALGLVAIDGTAVRLTGKGRLLVEEISSLFRHPDIRPDAAEPAATRDLVGRHNFASTYPVVQW